MRELAEIASAAAVALDHWHLGRVCDATDVTHLRSLLVLPQNDEALDLKLVIVLTKTITKQRRGQPSTISELRAGLDSIDTEIGLAIINRCAPRIDRQRTADLRDFCVVLSREALAHS